MVSSLNGPRSNLSPDRCQQLNRLCLIGCVITASVENIKFNNLHFQSIRIKQDQLSRLLKFWHSD